MIPIIEPGHRADADGRSALALVEHAATLGAKVELPGVKLARKALARLCEVEADAARLRSGDDNATTRTATEYLAGKVTVDGILDAAVRDTARQSDYSKWVMIAAQAKANAAIVAQLATLGDRWVTDVLRPVVNGVLGPLDELAATIPAGVVDERTIPGVLSGVSTMHHRHLERDVRAAWARLNTLIDQWDEVHDLADSMRMAGLIPVRAARPSEDFRWRYLDRLQGSPSERHWFLLNGYRRGAEPGIFTETEVEAAGAEQAERADAAEAVERERREAAHRQAVEARQAKANAA